MSQVYYPQCRVTLSVVFDRGIAGGLNEQAHIIQVIPKDAQVNLTGYKEADTWSLAFDAKALPFNPDLLRSVAVEIFMFDAGKLFPSPAELDAFSTEEHLLVTGLADNTEITYGTDGRTFSMDGRDYTCLLLDRQWDPRVRVPTGRRLSVVVQDLVDEAVGATKHGGRTLTVEYVSDHAEPMVGQYRTKTNKKGIPVKDASAATYWDVIYKICMIEGCIVFVRNHKVIITDPQTLTLQNANKTRKVAYGRNLSNLQMSRKLGKEAVPRVKVTSYSSKARGSIAAVFPAGKEAVTTGIGTKKQEEINFVVHGVDDEASLRRYAESMYNSIARGEAKIKFSTRSLTDLTETMNIGALGIDWHVKASALDMLALRAGDPVVISFDPFNEQMMEASSPEQREQYLVGQGYSRAVAQIVAQEYEIYADFKRPFYVRDVGVSWSHTDGITLEVEAVNFVRPTRDDTTALEDPAMASRKLPKSTDNSKVGS